MTLMTMTLMTTLHRSFPHVMMSDFWVRCRGGHALAITI